MNPNSVGTKFATMAVMLVAVCALQSRTSQSNSATKSPAAAKPLLLEKNEGERRIWREPPPGDFILKGSPKNNGSWVSVKNATTETASVVFVFSVPGFENYMRCDPVPPDEKVVPLSDEEQKACSHPGHVIYKDLEEPQKVK